MTPPIPASTKALARDRGFLGTRPVSPFPLCDATGTPWHVRKQREGRG